MKLIFIHKNIDNNNILEICCILKPSTYLKKGLQPYKICPKKRLKKCPKHQISQVLKSGYA